MPFRGQVEKDLIRDSLGVGKRRDRFHLVPIYPHQVADRQAWPAPPDRAVVAYEPESEWTPVGGFEFLFSLHPNSLIEITKPDAKVIRGYLRGLHRGTGAINIASPENSQRIQSGIGAKTLLRFRKLTIDRLGRVYPVERELRTWHGEACI